MRQVVDFLRTMRKGCKATGIRLEGHWQGPCAHIDLAAQ